MPVLLLLLYVLSVSASTTHYALSSAELVSVMQSEHTSGVWRFHNSSGIHSYRWRNDNPHALLTNLRVMVIGGTHAKELVTTEVCRSWMEAAERTKPSWRQPQIEWLFVPIANPTGRDIVARALREKISTNHESDALCYKGECSWGGSQPELANR